MNLHGIVRGAINAVNPDVTGVWLRSSGSTTAADGTRTPTYDTFSDVKMQVQAATGDDLQHINNLNQQGVYRKVYLFGDVQGVVRPDAKGGDLLQFDSHDWLVVHVLETWKPDATGWCCVLAAMQ